MLLTFLLSAWLYIVSAVAASRQAVTFENTGFVLAGPDFALDIILDAQDPVAVHIAAKAFADDIKRVTGSGPCIKNATELGSETKGRRAVVVGTAGSRLIREIHQRLNAAGEGSEQKVITTGHSLDRQWESYEIEVMKHPLRGIDEALVLTGSDRRGAIYALYTLTEQFGISPFTHFSEIPPPSHRWLSFPTDQKLSHGPPTVKYRGIFLNDEQPVLWNWAKERFGAGVSLAGGDAPFREEMYKLVFELVLRLKGNYVWPAMWESMFAVDGLNSTTFPLPPGPNQLLADEMGVVMGTSHHEPMGRNQKEWTTWGKGPWSYLENKDLLETFWTEGVERGKEFENVWTVGMRGDGDLALPEANAELLQNITAAQQVILRERLGTADLKDTPQMWAMYKEVMWYFANGLEVPPDVTPLLADDNWGNLMAVMPDDKHPGGGGIYYHVDYVGDPRNYKWINTASLPKMWHQLDIARRLDTKQIWILNVGDLHFLETPTEYFLDLAYDFDSMKKDSLLGWYRDLAVRDLGVDMDVGEDIAEIMALYSMFASRRKAELVDAQTFSLLNYEEDVRILKDWRDLHRKAVQIYKDLNEAYRNIYYQRVLLPIELQFNLNDLYISVAKSNLYATQARSSANLFADHAKACLEKDSDITEAFHASQHGLYNHTLSQAHFNYQYWQSPLRESLPPISYVSSRRPTYRRGDMIHTRFTVENSRGAWPGDGKYNCDKGYECADPTLLPMDKYGQPRWVDISTGGPESVNWWIEKEDWVLVSQEKGQLTSEGKNDVRVYVSIDWDYLFSMDDKPHNAVIAFKSSDNAKTNVTIPLTYVDTPPHTFSGAIQGDRYVAMEAARFTSSSSVVLPSNGGETSEWAEIPYFGRTRSGMTLLSPSRRAFALGEGPKLTYAFYLTTPPPDVLNVTLHLSPALNLVNAHRLAIGVSLDDSEPRVIYPVPESKAGTLPPDWDKVVSNEIRLVQLSLELRHRKKGGHTISLWGMTSGLVVERLIVDLGGVKERGQSYLGPPESVHLLDGNPM